MTSPESDALSKVLKHRGFSFVGPTVVYAYMQAAGMVNDHLVDCFHYREIRRESRRALSWSKQGAVSTEHKATSGIADLIAEERLVAARERRAVARTTA